MAVSNTMNTMTDGGGRPPSSELVYDPSTGKWVSATASNTSGTTPESPSDDSSKVAGTGTSSQVDSKTAAEKEYIEVEFNILSGELSLTSTEKSIRININDTIVLEGLGKYLSGQYYVCKVRRTIDKNKGYTHTITVLKNGFGSSLKQSNTPKEEPRKEEVLKSPSEINVGDSVKIVGENAVYSNASDGVKVPAWVKKKTHTVDAISSDGTRVRLKEIWSWTYIKYIQKV